MVTVLHTCTHKEPGATHQYVRLTLEMFYPVFSLFSSRAITSFRRETLNYGANFH